jgi:nondiscriminating glutamyl-tRNA synthetase
MNDGIRVRFAPAPTGYLHIGGARTALFNWLFARKMKGTFVLRSEDTDLSRSSPESEKAIMNDLIWLGLNWDEGADRQEGGSGGESFGPYRQTERLHIYREYADRLVKKGLAYPCYCTGEELEERRMAALSRKETPLYDGRCRELSAEEERRLLAEGRRAALRFKVPPATVTVEDLIRGLVQFDASLIGDFVIMKSNGTPSYNFAVVVDDFTMGISHIIRGDEHLTNTPRQIMLYRALEAPIPNFAHIPMILAPDHTKLSKRHGTTSVAEFREQGFLPEAIINYIALLGWAPESDREFFDEPATGGETSILQDILRNMTDAFSLDRVARNPAVFDAEKMKWMNGHYIRRKSGRELLLMDGGKKPSALAFLREAHADLQPDMNRLEGLVDALKDQIQLMSEIAPAAGIFLDERLSFSEEARGILADENSREVLRILDVEMDRGHDGFQAVISAVQGAFLAGQGRKIRGKELYFPIRAALTGKVHGPELAQVIPLLGKEMVKKRIREALSLQDLKTADA